MAGGSLRRLDSEARTAAEVSTRFAEAITAGNLTAALECWSPFAAMRAPDGTEARGHAALAKRFSQLIDAGAQLRIKTTEEIATDPGSLANTHMRLTVTVEGEPVIVESDGVVFYVRENGRLRILVDRVIPG